MDLPAGISATLSSVSLSSATAAESLAGSKPPDKISRELANAIQDDRRRQLVNDAKFRAAMVSVAHLEPLSKAELGMGATTTSTQQRAGQPPAWRFGVGGGNDNPATTSGAEGELYRGLVSAQPQSAAAFEKAWQRGCKTVDERLRYLMSVPPDRIPAIFKVEVSPALLADVVIVLEEHCCRASGGDSTSNSHDGNEECTDESDERKLAQASLVLNYLDEFAKVARFGLTVQMAKGKLKQPARGLIEWLESTLPPERLPDVQRLRKLYAA
eukprot:jgi/Chlat1/3617/Chrsp237S03617